MPRSCGRSRSPYGDGLLVPEGGPAARRSRLLGRAKMPDEAEGGEHAQHVVREVDLPPAEALPGRRLVVVMVVVPALAHGEEGDEEVVAAIVGGRVAARADEVRQRVDGEGAVP